MKAGAYDYIVKAVRPRRPLHADPARAEHRSLRSENLRLKSTLEAATAPPPLVGVSPAMKHVLDLVASVAATEATVLVTGESGTGKELVATPSTPARPAG